MLALSRMGAIIAPPVPAFYGNPVIIVANTKGFTGHPMGVGIEDVIGVKMLEHQVVPPVPNLREPDPDLGDLTLSKGGRYDVEYAIHLAAGFGSQIALTLTRRIPGPLERVDDRARHARWLSGVSGQRAAETEVVKRVLRVKSPGGPGDAPLPSPWRFGLGPVCRVILPEGARAPEGVAVPDDPLASVLLVVPECDGAGSGPAARLRGSSRPHASPASPAPTGAPRNDVVERILAIVAEKTGYPPEMLEMDLDLEADLGVDTVKQAEVFAAVREAYGIARQENLKLRDFPTLQHVVKFVYDFWPDPPEGARATEGVCRCCSACVACPGRRFVLDVVEKSARSSPRRPATPRTCSRWTSTSRPTSASTP